MRSKTTSNTQYIFWCYTRGHEEDWFIQASSKQEAKSSHAAFEGFGEEDVKARLVCEVPQKFNIKSPDWPTKLRLKKLGFEFLQEDQPRIVRYKGQIFKEGTMMEIFFDYHMFKKPLTYLMKIRGQDHYKIGYSENVYRRKNELSQNSPYHLDIIDTIVSPLAKRLENEIQEHFKKYASSKEWLTLDKWGASVLKAVFDLYNVEYSNCSIHHITQDFFYVLIDILKELLNEHIYNSKPSRQKILRLNEIYDIIAALRSKRTNKKSNEQDLADKVDSLEQQINEIKERLTTQYCPFKVGDVITDIANRNFIIKGITASIYYDKKKFKKGVHYWYHGNQLKKDGTAGKRTETIFHLMDSIKNKQAD